MLRKLLKHEWKGAGRVGGLILLALAAITLLGWLAFQSPMWRGGDREAMVSGGILDLMSVLTLILYVVLLTASAIGIFFSLAIRFYRTMYSGEGYLTNTLPVTRNKLLISKILVGGVWLLIVYLAILVSIFLLVCFSIPTALPDGVSVWEAWQMFFYKLREVFDLLFEGEAFRVAYWCLSMLIAPFTSLTILFGAISLGQLFTKHRILMAVVCYIGVLIGKSIILNQGALIVPFFAAGFGSVGEVIGRQLLAGLFADTVTVACMYFASYIVVSKKLNLE